LDDAIRHAEQLEREGKFDEAAEAWAALAAQAEGNPSSPSGHAAELQRRRAKILVDMGSADEAIAVLDQLLTNNENSALFSLLARAYLEVRRHQDAIDAARRAIELDSEAVLARMVLGRAHMASAEGDAAFAAMHWQEAIDQFTDILLIFNPHDELAQELKRYCIVKRDNSFDHTMRSEFRRFSRLIEHGLSSHAFEVLSELTRIVVEHAFDIALHNPDHTVQIVRDFIAMVATYSRSSALDLVSNMSPAFTRLRSAEMWAQYFADNTPAAEIALERAIQAAPESTLAWTSKAELMALLDRPEDSAAGLARAENYVTTQYDRVLLAGTLYMLGDLDGAASSLDQVNVEDLKSEAVRADRAESILQRLRSDIDEDRASGRRANPSDLSFNELVGQIKRKLSASRSSAEETDRVYK
jgi:tetratricopeptide (TPR) repeat protein